MLNWDADDLLDAFASTGLTVDMVVEQNLTQMHISSAFLERLFATNSNRPSYAQRLGGKFTLEELERLKATFTQYLLNQTIDWQSAIAFLKLINNLVSRSVLKIVVVARQEAKGRRQKERGFEATLLFVTYFGLFAPFYLIAYKCYFA
jgi:hypothetical protein